MHKKLFIPGPIDVQEDVLAKFATQQIGHRGAEASRLQRTLEEGLQKVFQTENRILISTSSGTGLMEGAVRSCTKERAAVFSCGSFGDKFYKICKLNGIPADKYRVEMGEAITADYVRENLLKGKYDLITLQHNETSSGLTNPLGEIMAMMKEEFPEIITVVDAVSSLGGMNIPQDEWGIDILITSSQKCFGLPAGISFAGVTERSIEKARTIENRGLYFDYVTLYDFILKKDQYPSTPTLPHYFGLEYQLERMEAEGLENRFKRHHEMALEVQAFAKKYFALKVKDEKYLSDTITCVENTRGLNISEVNKLLEPKGYIIANGYGDLKDVTFRISHMGDYTVEDVRGLLDAMIEVLGLEA
ncbi:MAG: alanine--glyoxylate aminotransferase family protein [Tissierellia bacterium]|nr:alanine--glyoxylate aminotransferase family protein [Tissierellia bacterium]